MDSGLIILCILVCLNLTYGHDGISKFSSKTMEDFCNGNFVLGGQNQDGLRLNLTKKEKYSGKGTCAMRIQAPIDEQVMMRILSFDIKGKQDFQCSDGDYVQLIDGETLQQPPLTGLPQKLCSRPDKVFFITTGQYMVINFNSNNDTEAGVGFEFLMAPFTPKRDDCYEDEKDCPGKHRCVTDFLKCSDSGTSSSAMPSSILLLASIVIVASFRKLLK